MQGDTQADHLAKRISQYTHYPVYELALPYVKMIDRTYLEELEVDDVLVLDKKVLNFIVLKDQQIVAEGILKEFNKVFVCNITKLVQQEKKIKDKKLKISFGNVQCKALLVGAMIDMVQININKIILMYNGKKIAKASLLNVEEKLAVKIEKVKK